MRRSLNLSWANQEAKPARRVTFVKATWGSDQGCVLKHGELARSGSRELPALGILEREYSKGKPPPPPGGSPAEGLRGGGGALLLYRGWGESYLPRSLLTLCLE